MHIYNEYFIPYVPEILNMIFWSTDHNAISQCKTNFMINTSKSKKIIIMCMCVKIKFVIHHIWQMFFVYKIQVLDVFAFTYLCMIET